MTHDRPVVPFHRLQPDLRCLHVCYGGAVSIIRKELIGNQTLLLGDCLDALDVMKAEPRVLMTDPPYSSGGFQEAGKGAGSIGDRQGSKIANDNLSTRGYGRLMRRVMLACPSLDEAYLFTDWRMWINTFDAIEDGGFRVRAMIVWDKGNAGMGAAWRSQHELIGYGKKTSVAPGSPSAGTVLKFGRTGNPDHPTQKPVELMEALLKVSAAGVVLDPFMGSGTTLVACERMGRSGVGIELSPEHFETACRRVDEETRQRDLFIAPTVKPTQEAFGL